MSQLPTKTTAGKKTAGGLAESQYVDPNGNLWVIIGGGLGGVTTPGGAVIPFNVDAFGDIFIALPTIATQTVPNNSTSTAYETSRLAKATSGVCFGVSGYSSRASSQFILLLDFAGSGVPANATVPVIVVPVPATSAFSIDFGRWGRKFSAGIWAANSSTGPTLTIGSADTWFDVRYF